MPTTDHDRKNVFDKRQRADLCQESSDLCTQRINYLYTLILLVSDMNRVYMFLRDL